MIWSFAASGCGQLHRGGKMNSDVYLGSSTRIFTVAAGQWPWTLETCLMVHLLFPPELWTFHTLLRLYNCVSGCMSFCCNFDDFMSLWVSLSAVCIVSHLFKNNFCLFVLFYVSVVILCVILQMFLCLFVVFLTPYFSCFVSGVFCRWSPGALWPLGPTTLGWGDFMDDAVARELEGRGDVLRGQVKCTEGGAEWTGEEPGGQQLSNRALLPTCSSSAPLPSPPLLL